MSPRVVLIFSFSSLYSATLLALHQPTSQSVGSNHLGKIHGSAKASNTHTHTQYVFFSVPSFLSYLHHHQKVSCFVESGQPLLCTVISTDFWFHLIGEINTHHCCWWCWWLQHHNLLLFDLIFSRNTSPPLSSSITIIMFFGWTLNSWRQSVAFGSKVCLFYSQKSALQWESKRERVKVWKCVCTDQETFYRQTKYNQQMVIMYSEKRRRKQRK